MIDKEKIIRAVGSCFDYWLEQHRCLLPLELENVQRLKADTLTLLNEQETVKPIYNKEKYGDHLPHCGNCEKVLPNRALYGKVNFCHYCGKAVKWYEG